MDDLDTISIRPCATGELPMITALAERIWPVCYADLLSPAQIAYMLRLMYAPERLAADAAAGTRFDLLCQDVAAVGYAAYGPATADGAIKLHKLYLLPELHGRGLGGRLLEHVLVAARALGGRDLTLQVNRGNAKAIACYQRHGFTVRGSQVFAIGDGFVMDDHVMGRRLDQAG